MPQTVGYIVFGALTVIFVLAWGFYVRKMGGFLEYVNRPWQSIGLFAVAFVIGVIVYFAVLSTLKYPSDEQIRKTPSWEETKQFYRTGESPDDNKTYDNSVGTIKDDEESKSPSSDNVRLWNPIDAAKQGNRRVVMDSKDVWREQLEAERDNAKLLAKQIGIAGGFFSAAIGYMLLGVSLSKKNAERDALAAEAAALVAASAPPAPVRAAAVPFEEGPAPREPQAPPPLPTQAADTTTLADDSDAPISLDDLDRDYQQYLKDKGGKP